MYPLAYLYLTDLKASVFSVFVFKVRYFFSGSDLSNSLVKHQLIMSYAVLFSLCLCGYHLFIAVVSQLL